MRSWDDQGEREPDVSNTTAWLWKLVALGFSVAFIVLVVVVVELLLGWRP